MGKGRRNYRQQRRAEQQASKREAIVRATVALHARHGTLATSYPMIAARAKVSTQTVYNHFPELGQLLGACTGHVLARAPVLNADTLRPGRTPRERLRLLATAVCEQQAYLAPWMRLGWHEARVIPELGKILDAAHGALRELIAQAVAPERTATREFVDAALALLEYPGWSQLSQGRTPQQTAALMASCLIALLPELTQPTPQEPK